MATQGQQQLFPEALGLNYSLQTLQQLLPQVYQKIQQEFDTIKSSDLSPTSAALVSRALQAIVSTLVAQIEKLSIRNDMIETNDHRDYQNLETALQKAEAEIRKHIRLQQQLKIYMDGLEERIEELEKQLKYESNKYNKLYQSVKTIDYEKKQLQKKLKIFELKQPKQKRNFTQQKQILEPQSIHSLHQQRQKQQQRQKVRMISHKASKILTEPATYENNSYSNISKIYNERFKPIKSRNFRQRSDNKIIHSNKFDEMKTTQKKGLDSGQILVNLSYNQKSYQSRRKQSNKTSNNQPEFHPNIKELESEPKQRQLTQTIHLKQFYPRNSKHHLLKLSNEQKLRDKNKQRTHKEIQRLMVRNRDHRDIRSNSVSN